MRSIVVAISLLVWGLSGFSQDMHFSQFYSSPILLNPSNTGYFNGNYRFGLNYKNQWPFATSGPPSFTYNTYSAYFDLGVLENKWSNTDWVGFGVNAMTDVAGDGLLKTTKYSASFAYHKGLSDVNTSVISVGFNGAYIQRSVAFQNFYFDNQWTNDGWDFTIDPTEPVRNTNGYYLDFGAGLSYHLGFGENNYAGFGVALLHINRPKDTFYNSVNQIGMRYVVNGEASFELGQSFVILPGIYYTNQKKASEFVFGTLFEYKISSMGSAKSSLYFGSHYRLKDAIIPAFGYKIHKTRLIVNYDLNASSLKSESNGNGGLEISLVHVGAFKDNKAFGRKIYCPKF